MSVENRNIIYQIDYSQSSDAGQWTTTGSNPVAVVDDKLRLIPNDASTIFERELGNIDGNNNRLVVGFDLEIFRPLGSLSEDTDITFNFLVGSEIVGTGTVCVTGIDTTNKAFFHLDRTFEYENTSGALKVQINVPNGFSNFVDIRDVLVQDFTFCDDQLTMYFIFDGFFQLAQQSKLGLIDLNSYQIDGQETLTTEFFNEQGGAQLDESSEWLWSDADVDGANRFQDNDTPKSFNPFVKSFGLEYEDTPGNYFGGFPTGTASGSNYGPGILNLGWIKPEILNELLESLPGAMALKCDLTKSLKISFTMVLSNDSSGSVYDNPFYHRRYTIEFDAVKCETLFYYFDVLRNNTVDQIHNGWLYGITGQQVDTTTVACDENFSYNGNQGTFEFLIDFGLETGQAGIDYNSFNVPDKFTIEWDGQIITSGYVGSSSFDQQLINLGVPNSELNTGPGTATGTLLFNKTTSEPRFATVRVDAPLGNTGWTLSGICPTVNSGTPIEVAPGKCDDEIPTSWTEVYVDTQLPASQYLPTLGDVLYTDPGLTTPYDGSEDIHRVRIPTSPLPTVLNLVVRVDANGVITGIKECSITGSEDAIEIQDSNVDNCETCWCIRVNVPATETRSVEFVSNFAPAGQYGSAVNCPCIGISVIGDGTANITADTTFLVGIDGAQPAPIGSGESTITIIVRDGSTVVDILTLSRIHINANC